MSATVLPFPGRRRGIKIDVDAVEGFVRLTAYTCTGSMVLQEDVAEDCYTVRTMYRINEALCEALSEVCPPSCEGTCAPKRVSPEPQMSASILRTSGVRPLALHPP